MFTPNKEVQRCVDVLYEKLRNDAYGTKYSWKELFEKSELKVFNEATIYYISNKVCLMLMKNDQKYLETVFKFGKRMINPTEHQLVAKKTANKSVKIYKKAGAILASTNMEELNEEQKKEVIEAANKYTTLEMFTNEMLKKKKIGQTSKEDIRTASLFLDTIKMFANKE